MVSLFHYSVNCSSGMVSKVKASDEPDEQTDNAFDRGFF